jgi:hypothetical protein
MQPIHDKDFRKDETPEHKQFIRDNQITFIHRYDDMMSAIPHLTYDFTHQSIHSNNVLVKLLSCELTLRRIEGKWLM